MLCQLLPTNLSKSELFACLQKVDCVTTNWKRPIILLKVSIIFCVIFAIIIVVVVIIFIIIIIIIIISHCRRETNVYYYLPW